VKTKDEVKTDKSTKKPDLFNADGDNAEEVKETPIWLVFTAKSHIIDSQRLKPGKMYASAP
jgi:phosphoglycerate dehydrogenase-like enzyme